MSKQAPQAQAVQVVSTTWARDSHDLFDFEARHLHTKSFTVSKGMKCVRSGTETQFLPEHVPPPDGSDLLLRLVERDGTFWVDKAQPTSGSKKLWLVVRDLPTSGSRLQEHDVMKLGRFKFRVRQMASPSEPGAIEPELRLEDTAAQQTGCCYADQSADVDSKVCRICLMEGPGDDDHMISPCQCKGSIASVHLGCLRHWIRGRLNIAEGSGNGSYFYQSQMCELCRSPYPAYVRTGAGVETQSPLVELPKTTPPFIVLENMVRDPSQSGQHQGRGLHVISLAENKLLKIGRGHESDVRIADVSISRCHATIRFHRGQFVLEDNHSKFGTLLAMKKPRSLDPDGAISIQVGRTVLSLKAQSYVEADAVIDPPLGGGGSCAVLDSFSRRVSLLARGPRVGAAAAGAAVAGRASAEQLPADADEVFHEEL